MPPTRAKAQNAIDAVGFNDLISLYFESFTPGNNQVNSTIQGRIFLPTAVKIYRVVYGWNNSGAGGSCSLNIVAGTAAESGNTPVPDTDYAGQPAYPPAYAQPGQQLFPVDQPISLGADVSGFLTPSALSGVPAGTPGNAWDCIWGPGGAELTLRCVTGTTPGRLFVGLLCKYYDPTYAKPVLTPFNPAVDIV